MDFPKYAKLWHSHVAFESIDSDVATYYRSAGNWSVEAKIVNDKLMFNHPGPGGPNGEFDIVGEAVTKEEWTEDNWGYV